MINKVLAEKVLERAMSTGGDFAELFIEDRVNQAVSMRDNRIDNVTRGRMYGVGLRVYNKLNSVYVYGNDTHEAGLMQLAAQAAAAISGEENNISISVKEKYIQTIHKFHQLPGDIPGKRVADVVRQINASAYGAGSDIKQAIAGVTMGDQNVCIINSDGLFVTDRRVYTRAYCEAIASNGTENQSGFSGPGALKGFEHFDTINPDDVGREAARIAVTMLSAEECPGGTMPVVIAGGFGGVIFHEACGHSLEATSVAHGNSEFAGKLGQTIANPIVTAIDDGTLPNYWGSENIDDEGTPPTKLVLIENGILKNFMIDRLNGRRMGMPVTGSARRQSYAFAPTSRMRNTYIAAGEHSDEEMISTMGDGLFAANMGGGSVNPITGEFNFAVTEGYLVRGGKIVKPVRGASLIGRGSEVLMRIDRVGRDMTMAAGMCGSLSGSVPTNVGQPMIRVSSLIVGGR